MSLLDSFSNLLKSLEAPADRHETITPHDTNELAVLPRALRFNAAGTVVVTMPDSNGDDVDVTYTVQAGEVLNIRPKKVLATGTSPTTGIVAWW